MVHISETRTDIFLLFYGIEMHDMPNIRDDGLVQTITCDVVLSLHLPHIKRPLRRPRKKRIESQFQDKWNVHCSRCYLVVTIAKL